MLSNTPPCAQTPLPDRWRGHVEQRRDARVPAGREFHKMFPPLHEGVNGGAVLDLLRAVKIISRPVSGAGTASHGLVLTTKRQFCSDFRFLIGEAAKAPFAFTTRSG